MATGIAKPTGLTTSGDGTGERMIRSQLRRAGQHVKWVEAGSQLLTLLVGTLIFFLTAALIDHWILSLGWFGRWVLCLAFVAGSGWFVVTRILPLFIRTVNPTYSARAIEEAQPTLKNSLINFLLLKQDRAGVKESVIEAMEQQAASDIATVEVDTAIDRAPLIRMGYVLCGVLAVVALYKIASPKDPFQTVARVVAPWSDISRPSRVLIREVQPGHTSVYLGSQVEVTADVQGLRGKDEVKLIYSSADGQVLDRVVTMKNAGGGSRYTATLPAEDKTENGSRRSASGLQQGVQYHVEAGDAISSIYEIRVRMKPTIAVEKAELNFPNYTQKAPQTLPTGEIKALEGTRVTIHARANQPIKTAVLEFEPKPGRQSETLALQVDGQNASGTFTLQLKPDRLTPWRESYQVRFTNEQGETSEQPVLHRIEVTPDLPPEVEILAPRLQKVDLPADSRLTIEVRGVDPDFALFDLFVAGKVTGGQIFRKSLLPPNEIRSQATGKFEFVPAEYDLKPGTIVTYQGVAIDNRRDPVTGQPQPGRAETAEYTIQITPPRSPQANNQKQPQPNDPNQQQRQPNDPQNPGAQQNQPNNNPPPMQKPGEKPMPMPGEPQPPMPGNQEKPEQKPGEPNQPMQKPQQDPMSGGQKSGNPSSGQSGSGQGESSQGSGNEAQPGQGTGGQNNNSQQGDKPPMPGEGKSGNSGQSGGQNQPGQNQPGQSDPNGSGQSGTPSGAQNSGQSQPGSQNAPGNQGGSGQDQPEGDTTGGPGDPTGQAGGNNAQPGNNKPQHDGEKFEKFLENMKKELEAKKQREGAGNNQPGQQQPGNSSQQPNQNQPGNNSQPQNPAGGKPQSAQPGSGKPGENPSDQQLKDIEQMLKEQRAQEGQGGKEPKPNETAQGNPQPGAEKPGEQPGAPQPQPMGQQPGGTGAKPQPNGNPPEGAQPTGTQPMGSGNQPMGEQPKPGEQGGPQNGAGQKPTETKGGEPKGTPRNTEGKEPSSKKGEQKNPGAGDTSDPGAGQQSQDPNGSGQGQDQNQNTKKEMKPDQGGSPKSGEPGSNSITKKQSDSKGGQGGEQSGGGQQGGGQSTGQQGNDSPGGSSAADEGAGAAKEQGKGETGSKAGKGQEAPGKTGASGQKPGEGSATKPDQQGTESGKGQGGKQPGSKTGEKPQPGQAGGDQGNGAPAGGGSGGDVTGGGITKSSEDVSDEANLEYTRKVTDLVLERLRDQEHNPDPELAKRANLTPQELQEFARRWSQLKKDAETDPNKARELDEALRSLGMKDPKNRRRAGASANDKQRDLRDAGGRTQAPSKYREQFDQFRKSTGNSQR